MPDISSLQIATPGVGILAVFLSFILYYVVHVVYLLFFHPLAKFPGPKLAAISDLWWVLRLSSGRLPFITEELHKKHGDVIRIGPNELSFASAQAFQEIHGHISKGKARFLKTEFYENDDPTPRITSARDPELHSRQRKALSHAFSAQALRHQEDIIQKYVDGFIQQIARSGENGKTALNMSDTFNWLTFDVIGDLAFGEPFGSVEQGQAHPWINIILDGVLNAQIIFMRRRRPLYNLILPFILPKGISQNHKTHRRLGVEKGRRRLAMGDRERDDFFSHMLKKKTLSEKEMISQSPTLIIAGSETTATSLTGTTWFLLKNPECMAKIQKEVRCAFASLDEITGDSVASLPYLHGVIEESLRLFPPVPFALPRHSPGAMVDGHYIPKGTVVWHSPLNMPWDPRYWQDAESFRPERWIGDGFDNDWKKASQPFSTGPRACLGINLAYLEMRIALAKMVWAFEWELAVPRDEWVRDCKMKVLWKKADLWVKYHPRATV